MVMQAEAGVVQGFFFRIEVTQEAKRQVTSHQKTARIVL